ncbi:cytochrome P450 [Actinophytocola sediminis]
MTSTEKRTHDYPFNDEAGTEIHGRYAVVREHDGLTRVQLPHGEPAWLVTRYADARFVLGDSRFSRAESQRSDLPRMSRHKREVGVLMSADPPDHTRLRRLVGKAFTMRRVEHLRPGIAGMARRLLDQMRRSGAPADLVEAYALPIPVEVICELLGVPIADRVAFRAWSDAALSTSGLTAAAYEQNMVELRDYITELVARHRAQPRDDLMTALIEARDTSDRLSEFELVDLCIGILVAGHETTASQIPNFVYTLREQPGLWDRLCADPGLVPGAVEELLRYIPLGARADFPRYATEDVEVGGTLVRAGDHVLVAIGAANRDGGRFADPDRLVIDRKDNHHVGFGHGIHHCVGAPLARVELQEAMRTLVTEMPTLHVVGEIEWKRRMLVRGPRHMWVEW